MYGYIFSLTARGSFCVAQTTTRSVANHTLAERGAPYAKRRLAWDPTSFLKGMSLETGVNRELSINHDEGFQLHSGAHRCARGSSGY